MKSFSYTIKAKDGLHARPAGRLAQEAARFTSDITLECGDKSASVKKLFALMKLGVKQGDEVSIKAEGEDEEAAMAAVQAFMEENF